MKQLSNNVYCDDLFDTINISQAIFASPYANYPYLILKNFFSKEICDTLTTLVKEDNQTKQKAKVREINASSIKESYRKTTIGTLESYYERTYEAQFDNYKAEIEDYFSVAMTQSTQVQVLEYTKGFFYVKHADDSSELLNKEKETVGFKVVVPQRKLSSVLFVTSHDTHAKVGEQSFSGGELLFNYLYDKEGNVIKIEPEAGDMIVFPSHPYFSHEVLEVEEGYRLTLVQWHDTV
ncbi:MAG: 2OG-Fe(II) oxygenase [Sulfurovum sp.]|nr:2OG-Fe(II) oxygenase [Sulfurovum sp.]